MQPDAPGYDIPELLALMRRILLKLLMGLKNHKERLHHVFLCGRNDPLNAVSALIYFLEEAFIREHDLLRLRLLEKVGRRRSQAFDKVKQSDDRRCYQSVLELRNISLRKLCPVST